MRDPAGLYWRGMLGTEKRELLRSLPAVDAVLRAPAAKDLASRYGTKATTAAVREVLRRVRQEILAGGEPETSEGAVLALVSKLLSRQGLRRAVDGSGGGLLIEGPPGIGKSALLAFARQRARRNGMTVVAATGAELERDFGFGLVRQLYEVLLASMSGSERQTLFAGAARLAEPLFTEGPAAPGGAQTASLNAALHGLYWLTVNLTDRGPLLLSVDDAHWGDDESLRYLAYLARRTEGVRLQIICAGRPPRQSSRDSLWSAMVADPALELMYP